MELLPEELLAEILSYITRYEEICVVCKVCSQWHRIIWGLRPSLRLERFSKLLDHQEGFTDLLQHTTRLKRLFMPTNTSNSMMEHISRLSSLKYLGLRRCRELDDEGLKELHRLQLEGISLSCSWNISHLDFLRTMSGTLNYLELRGCDLLTDESFISLAEKSNGQQFDKLTNLDIRDCNKITDAGIEVICSLMPNLERLDVSGCPITFAASKNIAKLKHLRVLILWGCQQLDDLALSFLAQLPQLQSLNLVECDLITDRGLSFIAASKALTSLELGSPGLSDHGVKQLLSHAQRLSNLSIFSTSEALTEEHHLLCRQQYPQLHFQHVRLVA